MELAEDERRSFIASCELLSDGGFIGGGQVTGETFDNRALATRDEITITAGMSIPAGQGRLLSRRCGVYDGSNRTMFWALGGAQVVLVQLGGFFDVFRLPGLIGRRPLPRPRACGRGSGWRPRDEPGPRQSRMVILLFERWVDEARKRGGGSDGPSAASAARVATT